MDTLALSDMPFSACGTPVASAWAGDIRARWHEASLQQAMDGYLVHSEEGRILEVSARLCDLTGFRREDLLATTLFELCDTDPRQIVELIERNALQGWARIQVELRRAHDSAVPVELNARFGQTEGGPFHAVFVRDLTDDRAAQAREAELQARLARSERIESLGVLAGGVAHDLNNILGPLVGYPDLMEEELPPDSSALEMVREMGMSARRAAAVIQDLMTLARRGNYRKEPVNMNDLVSSYLSSPEFRKLQKASPEVVVETELDPAPLPIMGSVPHLMQVMMNLVGNAYEAMDSEGFITLQTRSRYLDVPVGGYDEISEGDYVVLRVADTGSGIPTECLQRIFEPFYTRKAMGRSGTGLGLAVVYGVVKDLYGYIDVKSAPGKGSEFTVYFPVTRETTVKSPAAQSDLRGGERILIVDDIEEQRRLADRLLSSLGYAVSTVPSGEACVEFLQRETVDLLVLDMIMPGGMDGLETLQQVQRLRPTQRCIIASGFAETGRIKAAMELGVSEYVLKPYTLDKIGQAVRRELDRIGRPARR